MSMSVVEARQRTRAGDWATRTKLPTSWLPRPPGLTRCTWASCHAAVTTHTDGWGFCEDHREEHILLRKSGDIRPRPQPPRDPRPNHLLTRTELLNALLTELTRPIPPPRDISHTEAG